MGKLGIGTMNRLLVAIFAAATLGGAAHAQDPDGVFTRFQAARAAAEAAIKADDLALAEQKLTEALALNPLYPPTLARLVTVQAARGEIDAGVESAARYAATGLLLDMDRNPERTKLKASPAYAAVGARLAENAKLKGALAWSLPIDGATPLEGVAYDPAGKRLFLSLVGGRSVLVGDRVSGFKALTGSDVGGVFGMAYDAKARVLWAAEASGPGIPRSEATAAATAVLKLDARTGKVLGRWPAPVDGVKHQIGDVFLGADGTLFASDSVGGAIYRLRPGGAALDVLVAPGRFGSPQGFAATPDGKGLLLADYTMGLARIDPVTGEVDAVALPPDTVLHLMDGVSRRGDTLYTTQNSTAPTRVLKIRVSPDGRRATEVDALISGMDDVADMALGAVVGDELVLVADSGWAGFDGDGKSVRDTGRPVLAGISLKP